MDHTTGPPGDLLRLARIAGDPPVVEVAGELDVATAGLLRAVLAEAVADLDASGGGLLVVDCADLEFVDSTGLSVLVAAHTRLVDRGGALVVRHPRAHVLRVLELTGLTRVFTVDP